MERVRLAQVIRRAAEQSAAFERAWEAGASSHHVYSCALDELAARKGWTGRDDVEALAKQIRDSTSLDELQQAATETLQ